MFIMFAMLTVFALFIMLIMFAVFTRSSALGASTTATASTAARGRGRARGPHPLRLHAVHHTIELLDDAIESAGRILFAGVPLRDRSLVGGPHMMDPPDHGAQNDRTSGHGQPLQHATHCRISTVSRYRSPTIWNDAAGASAGGHRQRYAATIMNGPAAGKFRDPALVDFGTDAAGRGRRLELLGTVLVDRPLIQPDLPRRQAAHWTAAAVFQPGHSGQPGQAGGGGRGGWTFTAPLPDPWRVTVPLVNTIVSLEIRPAPSGQLGVFLEQRDQWEWLARETPAASTILSLFAHSGAATLAMASAGAHVVHVDASRQAIALARRNAAASGLAEAPIRWVCEDARTFIARERRRGTRYDGVVLDPPSWGHGPKGQAFAIDRDLVPLVTDLAHLLSPSSPGSGPAGPVLLTCHSARWHHRRLHDTLSEVFPAGTFDSGPLICTDAAGRTLELGAFARRRPGGAP